MKPTIFKWSAPKTVPAGFDKPLSGYGVRVFAPSGETYIVLGHSHRNPIETMTPAAFHDEGLVVTSSEEVAEPRRKWLVTLSGGYSRSASESLSSPAQNKQTIEANHIRTSRDMLEFILDGVAIACFRNWDSVVETTDK